MKVRTISIAVTLVVAAMLGGSAGPAYAVTDPCTANAALAPGGTGNYTNDAVLIASVVKHPEASAYVLFRLKLAQPTCGGVKYDLIVRDASTGAVLGIGEDHGPGTFSTSLGQYVIEFQVPITQQPTPSGVCVSDVVTAAGEVVHRGPSGTCAIPGGGATWPGKYIQLNTSTGPGGEADM
jgi:hypothetical protein